MTELDQRIAELEAAVEKMTPGEWCWSFAGSKDNGYIVGSACNEHGEPHSGFIDINYATMIDPVMIGEHEAATVNYKDPAGIVALKNNAPSIITELTAALAEAKGRVEELEANLEDCRQTTGFLLGGLMVAKEACPYLNIDPHIADGYRALILYTKPEPPAAIEKEMSPPSANQVNAEEVKE